MKVILQRSNYSFVEVDNKKVGEISHGLVVLVGFTEGDSISEIDYIVDKILNLRIFNDENGIMNKSVLDVDGNILSISQFTLYANTLKGRRPSYALAMNGIEAKKLYILFNQKLKEKINVETGVFGADMKVSIQNDGPVTIVLESR
ncbi:MAG: D-aminoacyl-tRNA deacylase [Bacilli bacterium]